MSHWLESWKYPDLRSQFNATLTGCRRWPRSTTSNMARDPRRTSLNQDPVVAVAVVAAVSMLETSKT